ncbi:LPXTG cell wall anchor domain-containing protein [Fodinicola acaciae]|uniref:LPXTG cell wall anchor domain-containing protein n=1 Tax=Fodinicola acaciae TaxID=2681555 RepID=UPI0013CF70EB|nr:LPXTG cell wall anchor domain-containing protein [Fodinicola acaciae]
MRAPTSFLRPLAAAGLVAGLTLMPLTPVAAADTLPAPADPSATPSPPASKAPPKTLPKAAATPADLSVAVTGLKVAQGSNGKPFIVTVKNNSNKPSVAKSVVVDVQATALDNPSQLNGPDPASKTCVADEVKTGHFTCTIGDLGPQQKRNLQFIYAPKGGALPHTAGTITASAKSGTPDPNQKNNEATGQVDIVPGGIDLGTVIPDTNVTDVGGTATTVAEIRNTGTADAKNVTFSVRAPAKSTIKAVNLKGTDGQFSVPCKKTSSIGATCTVGDLQANFLATAQVQLTVSGSVNPGDVLTGGQGGVKGELKAAEAQTFAKKQDDTPAKSRVLTKRISSSAAAATSDDPSDNGDTYSIPISAKAKADLEVKLTKVTGAPKSDVVVKGTVSNHGPSAASGLYVDVTIPSDTGYAAIPSSCKHRGDNPRTLRCAFNGGTLAAYKSFGFQVKVQLHDTKPGQDGSAVVNANVADPVDKNNSVAMVIGQTTASNASNTNNGGTLPKTGERTGLIAFGGAALLLLGGALTLTARRRRTA